MHKKKKEKRLTYYAKISVVVSLTLLLYGLVLDVNNDKRLFDSDGNLQVNEGGKNTISITTSDGSEVVPGNIIVNPESGSEGDNSSGGNSSGDNSSGDNSSGGNSSGGNSSGSGGNSSGGNSSGSGGNSSGSGGNSSGGNSSGGNSSGGGSEPHVVTQEEINNNLRVEIQNNYGVTVRYGNETGDYTVGGFSTSPIQDANVISDQLNRLKNALSLYPSGMFNEIKNGGIPLSVYLVYSFSNNSITGITDSSYTYAVISIAAVHSFEESFYHESYHYIERYLFKRGANFNTWNSLNPPGFNYGVINQKLSYTYENDPNASFVNDYAQTAATEDRASTFEYMMSGSRASCMNRGTVIYTKASQMALTMDAVLNTVKPNVVEYWERYL